ncbi:MAG: Ig-like domain-containing protein [Marinifilaceae bacterium]|nr:Ig-like domain-containing protein [Marinifilaceae bacterium]
MASTILSSLGEQAALAIILLVCAFGCQKEDDTSVPLSITSTNIADGATEVDVFTDITVLFSEEVDVASVNENSFVVNKGQYPIYGKLSCTGKTAVFKPSQQLADNKEYNCTITAEVKGLNGQSIAQDYHWSFTSGAEPDLIAPTIMEHTPLNSEIWVFADSKIKVSFDEEIDPETINTSSFTIKNGTTDVSGEFTYGKKTATFTPDTELAPGALYTCVVTTGIKDLAGNPLKSNFEWSFTTIPGELSFSEMIRPIFKDQSCYLCHGGTQDPNLTESEAYASLVNGNYVNVDSPADSRIVKQLKDRHPGYATQKEEALILEWIKQGAKDN